LISDSHAGKVQEATNVEVVGGEDDFFK
jgi:hypothetical protein